MRTSALTGARARARATAIRALGIEELPLDNPWDYIQGLVERRLHEYIGVAAEEIAAIVVVGAWRGHELQRMLDRYPLCQFVCFEPVADEYRRLHDRYGDDPRVVCIEAAVGDSNGTALFHMPVNPGTGSLLAPVAGGRSPSSGTGDVAVVRLDDEPNIRELTRLDCLWIDVQGAELHVLAGATETLDRTHTVFAEVAVGDLPYERGASFDELDSLLERRGLRLVALGLDPRNGEGNALWTRRFSRPPEQHMDNPLVS